MNFKSLENPVLDQEIKPLMHLPLISIVIRTRDRPRHLQRAMESIAAQTYRPIEIIIVDDGTQSVAELISNYRTPPGISCRYVRSTPPQGRTRAANAGIAAATGAYLGLLDDDDTFSPNHLATLVPVLTDGGWQVGYSRCEIVEANYDAKDEQWTELNRYVLYADDFDPVRLLLENHIPLMTALFTREALKAVGGFDESLDIYEDWDLMIRLSARYPFANVRQITAQYYVWSVQDQGSLKVHGTAAEQEAYCGIIRKHRGRITPEVLHHYFTIAGQRLGGYLASERQLARARVDIEKLQEANHELYVQIEEVRRLRETKHQFQETNYQLQETNHRLQGVNQQLQEANRRLEEQVSQLYLNMESIKQGVGWKLLERARRVVATLFPPQTRRWRLYYLTRRVVATCLRDGWRTTGLKIALRIRRLCNRS